MTPIARFTSRRAHGTLSHSCDVLKIAASTSQRSCLRLGPLWHRQRSHEAASIVLVAVEASYSSPLRAFTRGVRDVASLMHHHSLAERTCDAMEVVTCASSGQVGRPRGRRRTRGS